MLWFYFKQMVFISLPWKWINGPLPGLINWWYLSFIPIKTEQQTIKQGANQRTSKRARCDSKSHSPFNYTCLRKYYRAITGLLQGYYWAITGLLLKPAGPRRGSAAARPLRLWVRIPPGAWIPVCCECCMLSGRGLCEELITHPEESYRLWCVLICDLETSWMRRTWPTGSCWAKHKKLFKPGGVCNYYFKIQILPHNKHSYPLQNSVACCLWGTS